MIDSSHPLFRELRNGLLWHCTSPKEFGQIRADGFIKPYAGPAQKWGSRPSACQELGGVSLFDFSTEAQNLVLASADKWQQFLGCARPVTVALGLDRGRLPGALVSYPENKAGTSGNVIPWVEVCHLGDIPVSAIASNLLVCAVDYARFYKHPALDEATLTNVEQEFATLVRMESESRLKLAEQIRALQETPEFREQLAKARRAIEKNAK